MNIVDIARKYIGTKEQFGNVFREDGDPNNNQEEFAALIHEAGQKDGESWCCYAAEVWFCKAFPNKIKELRKLFSANCFQTYVNFLQAGYKVLNYPVVGALCIYQSVKDGRQLTTGHASIVTVVQSKTQFTDISGNTNDQKSREGNVVAENAGHDTLRRENGKQVLGFIIIE